MVVLGPLWGPLWPWVCDMPILDIDEMGKNKKPFYLRIFLWEGHIVRRTNQNTPTLGVSLVVLGPPWGPLWPWVCDVPILNLDEVGKNNKFV